MTTLFCDYLAILALSNKKEIQMSYKKAGEIMLEAISMGVTDIHKMTQYKFIDMVSAYLEESNSSEDYECCDYDVISVKRHNELFFKDIVSIYSSTDLSRTVKLNSCAFEAAFAVYQENREQLDETFESKMSDFYNKEYGGEYFEI